MSLGVVEADLLKVGMRGKAHLLMKHPEQVKAAQPGYLAKRPEPNIFLVMCFYIFPDAGHGSGSVVAGWDHGHWIRMSRNQFAQGPQQS